MRVIHEESNEESEENKINEISIRDIPQYSNESEILSKDQLDSI